MRFEDRGDVEIVASATECTGLVPALHEDGGEASLRALYGVHRAKCPGKLTAK